jgi:hypothetical protein
MNSKILYIYSELFIKFEREDGNCIPHSVLGVIYPSPNTLGRSEKIEIIYSFFIGVLNLSERGHSQG